MLVLLLPVLCVSRAQQGWSLSSVCFQGYGDTCQCSCWALQCSVLPCRLQEALLQLFHATLASGREPVVLLVVNNWKSNRTATDLLLPEFIPFCRAGLGGHGTTAVSSSGTVHRRSLLCFIVPLKPFCYLFSVNMQSDLEFTLWHGLDCDLKVWVCSCYLGINRIYYILLNKNVSLLQYKSSDRYYEGRTRVGEKFVQF